MFELLPWQQTTWSALHTQRREARLPHALLFSGAQGVGKHAFARYFGASLLCDNPTDTGACHQCRSCGLIDAGSHPDLVELTPEEPGKVIKVDAIRGVIDQLHGTAQQGGYRVLLIYPAEEMNGSAANALLKTLEEPGEDTLIILVVDQIGQLMPTIRSRCQRINFSLPDASIAAGWLAQKLEIELEAAGKLLGLAQGAPLLAHQWKSEEQLELRAQLMSGLADIVRGRDTPVRLAETLYKSDLLLLLNWWSSLIGDIVRIQVGKLEHPLVNRDMQRLINAVAQRADSKALFELADLVQAERRGLQSHQNPNKQLLLEKLLFHWRTLALAE